MARRATSLGPKPSLFVFVVLFCLNFFCVWLCTEKGIFCLFSVFLFLSPLAVFGPPSFSVSLSLSLSFLLFFLYSFLSLFFAFFWFLVWVSFFIFLSSLVSFMKGTTSNIQLQVFFF